MFSILDTLLVRHGISTVIEGGARGADSLAGEWADDRGLEHITYHADWDNLGRKAGLIRNERMLKDGAPDLVIAFPGGRGTFHMSRLAEEAGVPVIAVKMDRRQTD